MSLASVSEDGELRVAHLTLDVTEGEHVKRDVVLSLQGSENHDNIVADASWHETGSKLASCSFDHSVFVKA